MLHTGTIPGPLAFGSVFDQTCSLWSSQCGVRGSCLLYDNWTLGRNLFLLSAGIKLVSVIFITGAILSYRPENKMDDGTNLVDTDSVVDGSDKISDNNEMIGFTS